MSKDHMNGLTIEHLTQTISITKVGVFIWNLITDHVIYSKEWAEIVGYELNELESHVRTWESMLLPEDLKIAEANVNKYLSGEAPLYESEFRMMKKDGSIIWGHDKGKITKYTEDGKPLILCGVLQDITSIKLTEEKLRESTDILNLAIEVAEFGTWDWDVEKGIVTYNDEYLSMLGYKQEEMTNTLTEWEEMNHPEDLPIVSGLLDDFIIGKIPNYECEVRMRHKDGHYIWTRDVGRIVSTDENGNAARVIGGHLNIDSLKNSQEKLEATLEELENHQIHLEYEIDQRTKSLTEQDKLLMAVNDISQRLLAVTEAQNFDKILLDSLENLTVAYDATEFTLWRFLNIDAGRYLCMSHHVNKLKGQRIAFSTDIAKLMQEGGVNKTQILNKMSDGGFTINYDEIPQVIRDNLEKSTIDVDLKGIVEDNLGDTLAMLFENTTSLLISPIYIYNDLFGFIAVDSDKEGSFGTEAHENMLAISGKLFANAQKKYEMDTQLRMAHEEALLSSQAKSNFLANMSHEIRTPLNAILGMSEIILRESQGRATEEYAVEIKSASESLLSIINDILDISKIESGKLEIIEVEYDIKPLLFDVINIAKIRLVDKSVIFTTHIDSNIPARLFGDEIRIKQILLNLLSNAIKFTKSGQIELKATCTLEDDVAQLVFSVRDTGSGIREEDMDKLFMQFERVDTKKNRNIEGTGLGLAITKQLCEMMNGSIFVESKFGLGATFTVSIPQTFKEYKPVASVEKSLNVLLYEARKLHADSIKAAVENLDSKCDVCTNLSELLDSLAEKKYDFIIAPAVHLSKVKSIKDKYYRAYDMILTIDPGDLTIYRDFSTVTLPVSALQLADIFGGGGQKDILKSKTIAFKAPDVNILVVDDNQINLKVAKGLMAPYKFNIEIATNGMMAVEMVKNNVYDLVFMDHMMPEMDGIDATAAIRNLEGEYYKKLPIIALTANALVGARELFVKEGMNDFLAKPIEVGKLGDILLKWIPKEKQQSAGGQKLIEAHDVDISLEGINTKYGIKQIGGNVDDYNDVLNTYFIDGQKKIDNLYDSYSQKNLNAFRIDVHALKSASASIGAFQVSEKAKSLEVAAAKEDWRYINSNVDDFLNTFTAVLNTVKGYLEDIALRSKVGGTDETDGELSTLVDCLDKLEISLQSLDMDAIEESLEVLLDFTWKGEINSLLKSVKNEVDAFEYYNARPTVDLIRKEMKKLYSDVT